MNLKLALKVILILKNILNNIDQLFDIMNDSRIKDSKDIKHDIGDVVWTAYSNEFGDYARENIVISPRCVRLPMDMDCTKSIKWRHDPMFRYRSTIYDSWIASILSFMCSREEYLKLVKKHFVGARSTIEKLLELQKSRKYKLCKLSDDAIKEARLDIFKFENGIKNETTKES